MDNYPPVEIKVWGDFACFTNAFHTERVTYDIPPPSASRGILEAVLAHPPLMRWHIREVVVLKPIRYFSILRNEVSKAMSPANGGISITDSRAQRNALILRDVAYIIKADVSLLPRAMDKEGRLLDAAKYRDQFRRRVEKGQCFHRPYLGCREFACEFGPPDGTEEPIKTDEKVDLGRMLFDIEYGKNNVPRFFQAHLEHGVLHVPQSEYERIGQ